MEKELRPCIVAAKGNERIALFHMWGKASMVNGFREFKDTVTLGIVEYENGEVEAVIPGNIEFTDNIFEEFYFLGRRRKN